MEIDDIERLRKKAQKIEDKIIYLEKDERQKRQIAGWAALALSGVNSVAIGKNAIVSMQVTFNIASGSEANITTPCEMEIFNFLWLIWNHYLPLAPT